MESILFEDLERVSSVYMEDGEWISIKIRSDERGTENVDVCASHQVYQTIQKILDLEDAVAQLLQLFIGGEEIQPEVPEHLV